MSSSAGTFGRQAATGVQWPDGGGDVEVIAYDTACRTPVFGEYGAGGEEYFSRTSPPCACQLSAVPKRWPTP
jgi:hypothetical protein